MANKVRVLVLFLTYGSQYKKFYKKFFEMCNGIILKKRLIIIRNDSEHNHVRQINDWTFEIGGDNSVFEFSGWQKAIESEICRSFKPDVYLLANDAFLAPNPSASFHALPVVDDEIIKVVCEKKLFAGNVRKIPFKTNYSGLTLSTYVRTHFFVIHSEIISKLGSIISETDSEKLVKPRYSRDFFTTNEIWNPQFRKYLYYVLTQRWHDKGMRLSASNYDFFKRKILCAINEQLLSARLRSLGYGMVDITPFSKLLNSFYILNIPFRPIVPFQFMRKIVFSLLHRLFYNRASRKLGLGNWFAKRCAVNVKHNLLRQI